MNGVLDLIESVRNGDRRDCKCESRNYENCELAIKLSLLLTITIRNCFSRKFYFIAAKLLRNSKIFYTYVYDLFCVIVEENKSSKYIIFTYTFVVQKTMEVF